MFKLNAHLIQHQLLHISRVIVDPLVISHSPWLLYQRSYSDIKTNEGLLFSTPAGIITPSPMKIKQSLRRGLFDFNDGPTCIQTVCPICPSIDSTSQPLSEQKSRTQHKKCLFINKTTGTHYSLLSIDRLQLLMSTIHLCFSSLLCVLILGDVVCSKCQHTYSFTVVEPFFEKQLSVAEHEKSQHLFLKSKPKLCADKYASSLPNAIPVSDVSPEKLVEILQHLDLHGITATALEATAARCDPKKMSLYFDMHGPELGTNYLGCKELFRNPENNLVQTRTLPESHSYGVIVLPPCPRKGPKDAKTAIVVLTLRDALALRMEKFNGKYETLFIVFIASIKNNRCKFLFAANVVCLPHGFKSLPQECLPALEQFNKLILWFEYDSVGWDIAKVFAKKLDEKRCYFIRPTENSPAPYEALQQSITIKSILAEAQPIVHEAVTTFRALRQDVLSDLQNIDNVEGIKWTRFPKLNELLRGHRRGELTVLTGPTGCGKTTFMSEFSLDLAQQGVNTLWGSFEIRNTILARTLLQQMVRKPLDEYIDEFDRWANEFEKLPMYFMTFFGQQPLKAVMEAIEHSQYVHDIHHVIIDNLQFMMGTSAQDKGSLDKYWKQDQIISSFRAFATQRNCHVTLVIHPRKVTLGICRAYVLCSV